MNNIKIKFTLIYENNLLILTEWLVKCFFGKRKVWIT